MANRELALLTIHHSLFTDIDYNSRKDEWKGRYAFVALGPA